MNIRAIMGAAALLALAACGQAAPDYRSIPAGFACRMLTANGYEGEWLREGMMNLGGIGAGGIQNRAVCVEVTTIQVKESFAPATANSPDNRILSNSGNRTSVDLYLRLIVPATSDEILDSVVAQITPRVDENDNRVSYVRVSDIFERFGRQEARSYARTLMVPYADDLALNNNRAEIENGLSRSLVARLAELRAPLELQGVSLSNIAADSTVTDARNNALTAESVRNLPSSYVEMQRIQAQERMIARLADDDQPHTIIFGINDSDISVPARQAQ